MAIEIADFPMKNGGSFHGKMLVHQRVLKYSSKFLALEISRISRPILAQHIPSSSSQLTTTTRGLGMAPHSSPSFGIPFPEIRARHHLGCAADGWYSLDMEIPHGSPSNTLYLKFQWGRTTYATRTTHLFRHAMILQHLRT